MGANWKGTGKMSPGRGTESETRGGHGRELEEWSGGSAGGAGQDRQDEGGGHTFGRRESPGAVRIGEESRMG